MKRSAACAMPTSSRISAMTVGSACAAAQLASCLQVSKRASNECDYDLRTIARTDLVGQIAGNAGSTLPTCRDSAAAGHATEPAACVWLCIAHLPSLLHRISCYHSHHRGTAANPLTPDRALSERGTSQNQSEHCILSDYVVASSAVCALTGWRLPVSSCRTPASHIAA